MYVKLENICVYECSGYYGPDLITTEIVLPKSEDSLGYTHTISIYMKAGTGKSYCLKHFKTMPEMRKSFPISNPD